MRPRQNDRLFTDNSFKCIFFNENVWISLKISLKFVPEIWIKNISALVQIMAWRWPGDNPLSEPMMVNLLTHICAARPHWVNKLWVEDGITTIFGGQDTFLIHLDVPLSLEITKRCFHLVWPLYLHKNNGKCNVINWEYSCLICWLGVNFARGPWVWTQEEKHLSSFVWKSFCCACVQLELTNKYEWWKCPFYNFSPKKSHGK